MFQISALQAPHMRSAPSHLCLRGGGGIPNDDRGTSLNDLLGRRNPDEPSVLDLMLDSFGRFPPSTAFFLVMNCVVYLGARLGILGKDPAIRLGMRADRLLLAPKQE
eukprot:1404687-Rhodomonas_salina.7